MKQTLWRRRRPLYRPIGAEAAKERMPPTLIAARAAAELKAGGHLPRCHRWSYWPHPAAAGTTSSKAQQHKKTPAERPGDPKRGARHGRAAFASSPPNDLRKRSAITLSHREMCKACTYTYTQGEEANERATTRLSCMRASLS